MATTIILPPIFISSEWGYDAVIEEEFNDLPYIAMTRKEFETAKQKAKTNRRFKSWNDWLSWAQRLESKRAERARCAKPRIARIKTILESIIEEKEEMLANPSMYFSSPEHMDIEIAKIGREISFLSGDDVFTCLQCGKCTKSEGIFCNMICFQNALDEDSE
jgi:hypothetical protein